MASRPTAARGSSGVTYGLITFVVLTVASLGAFIWQFTINSGLTDAADSAQRRLQAYGTPPSYYQDEATARNSNVASVMMDDFAAVAQLVTGKKEAVRPAIVETSNNLLATVSAAHPDVVNASDTLLTAIQRQFRALSDATTRIGELEGQVKQLQDSTQQQIVGFKDAREQFFAEVEKLKEEVSRLIQEKADALAKKDEQLNQQIAASETLNEELSREKVTRRRESRDAEIAAQRVRAQLEGLQAQIADIRTPFRATDILRKADGTIERAIPGSDVVYINLGTADRIKPGLNFEVFSPSGERGRGVGARGKASIEVTNINHSTAECRVTRTTLGRPIVEGDVIVNIAYERNRRPKFVIRGDFDLNYDGVTDSDGVEKVTSVIRAWGGQVVDEVDESTDFLVLGLKPHVPSLSGRVPPSAVVQDQAVEREASLAEFHEVIDTAKSLYVPVLTQNQFLYLTGYAGQEIASIR